MLESQNERVMHPKVTQLLDGCEDWVPPKPDRVIEGDFRPQVRLPGPNRPIEVFADELVKQLADKPIFNHGGIVSIVDDKTFVLRRMTPTKFRTWIGCRGGIVCNSPVKRGDIYVDADMSMSEETAKAVLDCPSFIDGLREVTRVNTVRLPVRRETGSIELLQPGYDPQSKILTIETVSYDENLPTDKAFEVFQNLLKDTAFDNRASVNGQPTAEKMRSTAVATAMILAPFCDCMLSRFDERPAFIVTANAEGAGKTLLVRMAICPVFGPAKLTPPRILIRIS